MGHFARECHANYTIVEEIPTGEEVLVGTFFLNECLITTLFDLGASHDSMSFTCGKKAKLSLVASGAPYLISTPGGRVDANQVAQNIPLDLSGRIFSTNLIILSGQGIDVILGMSWMKLNRAVLDIADRGSQFVARFWEQLHASLKTHPIHSLAYHPQTDGQTE
jgi:hypothetical protein